MATESEQDTDATRIARAILTGFDRHYQIFRDAARTAREHFEQARWTALRKLNRDRTDMYTTRVQEAVSEVTSRFPAAREESAWPAIKLAYIGLLYEHKQPELAETFFNSVAVRVLHTTYHNNQHIFSRPAVATEHIESAQTVYHCYYPREGGLRSAIMQVLSDFALSVPLAHPKHCLRNVVHAFRQWIPDTSALEPNFHVQVLSSLFYRNKAAYAVGRIVNGHQKTLFMLPLRHDPGGGGIYIEALIHEREHLANLLSVAHAYFMVDMEVPSSWITFVHEALPEKSRSELYTAVGLQRQGKILFIRDLQRHLKYSSDRFVIAPGARGMVMLVFTLPSFPYVFKVIRDRFQPPKDTSRELVMEKYQLVKLHERVGRMADTLQYTNVAFPLDRFDDELMREMRELIGASFKIEGDRIVFKHMYVEQRLKPLDMYMDECASDASEEGETRLKQGMREFGQALKDLAVANIFPGDLLPKNFGVSSYGRVLFYDYDEVCYLTECNFRELHATSPGAGPGGSGSDLDDGSFQPWYSVGPHDVFPEEFATFLFNKPRAREIFTEMHGDLLNPKLWTQIQDGIRAGKEADLYPYPEEVRFPRFVAKGGDGAGGVGAGAEAKPGLRAGEGAGADAGERGRSRIGARRELRGEGRGGA